MKPQINLFYKLQKTQMLIASRKSCIITKIESTLLHDIFQQDVKHILKIVFYDYECFSPSIVVNQENKPFWVDSYLYKNTDSN